MRFFVCDEKYTIRTFTPGSGFGLVGQKYCQFCRNNPVALEIIEQIQKVLNSRDTLKTRSTGHIREYLRVSEDHLRRRDFKKTVVSLSLVINNLIVLISVQFMLYSLSAKCLLSLRS